MKKTLKSFFVFVAAALTLVGCQKKEIEQPRTEGEYVYTFTIDDETRAVIGDSNIEWVAGDQVGIFIGSYGDYEGYKGYAKVDVNTTPKMVVLYSNTAIPAGAVAFAYAPYDSDNKNKEASEVKIVVNEIQIGAQNSAMPLAGLPFQVEEEIDPKAQNGNGQIKFMNLGSLINFKVYSSNEEYQSETIQSIQFEATKAIAGIGHIDLTAVDMNDESTLELVMDTEENTVKVNEEIAVAANKENAEPIKMVILPGTFQGTLTVVTDVATYTKTIPEREFARSHTRTFGLDLASANREEGVEEIVKTLPYTESFETNQGDFTIENITMPAGIPYVWSHGSHNSDTYMQANAYYNSNRYETESMLVSPWIDLTEVNAAEVSFRNAYKYVSTPANFFTFWVKTDAEGSEWTQETINNYGAGDFAWGDAVVNLTAYVGNKVKVAFKYVSGGTNGDTGTWEITNFNAHIVKADPELSFETTQFSVNVDENFNAPTLVNPHGVTVVYSSNNEDVALVDENTGEVVIGEAGVAVITASFAGDDNYLAGSASYSISVVDPSVIPDPETIVFADLGLTNAVKYTEPFSGGNFLISFGDGENDGTYYTTGSGIRTYADGKIYISSSYDIVRIEYTFASSNTPVAGKFTVNAGTLVPGATSVWTGSAKSIILTNTGTAQWRLQSVKVYYTEPVIPVYDIVVNSSTHGTVSSNFEQAEEGTQVTLTISPDEGYKLEALIVNDVNVTNAVSNGVYVFSMPAEDVTVSATFALIPVGEKTYTITWNATNNSAAVSSYAATWSVTADGLTCEMVNWNNNNNGWDFVKAGSKNGVSVATITTEDAIPEAIKTISLTIDAVTVSNINSLKLYVSDDSDFSDASEFSFTVAKGDQSVVLESPAEGKYYKVVADCKKGSSNGLITVSKLVFTTN